MRLDTPLHGLGFRRRPERKKKPSRKPRHKTPAGPPTNTTMDKIHNEFINMNTHLPADAPHTGIDNNEHDDAIRKGDEGFEI
ncbi:MAG: hypothetical protein V3W14_03750 [Candidatus Neomarinimicrobiota bacterium]